MTPYAQLGRTVGRLLVVLIALLVPLTAAVAAPPTTSPDTAADFEDIAAAKCIVSGRLSTNVHRSDDRLPYADIEKLRPLYVDRMPSEDGGWPKDKLTLRLTDADAFKPGDEGIWLLRWSDGEGWTAPHAYRFRAPDQRARFLQSLQLWLADRVTEQTADAVAALRKDPDGDREVTWLTVRRLATLLENEIRSPLYDDRPNENPVRVHLATFYHEMGIDLPIPPNPQTHAERAAAGHLLRPTMYWNRVLDQPDDPGFGAVLNQAVGSYWNAQLERMNYSLAADPAEFRGEVEMRRSVATTESAARQFPPGVKVTRMLMFLGHARATTATSPATASSWRASSPAETAAPR